MALSMALTVDQARERLSYWNTRVIATEREFDKALEARDRAEEELYDAEEAGL